MTEILIENLEQLIKELQKNAINGMSKKNLQQICPTKGLTCSIAQFHEAFDAAIKVVKENYPSFKIYEENPCL